MLNKIKKIIHKIDDFFDLFTCFMISVMLNILLASVVNILIMMLKAK